jgi:glyoxylase I family protein
MNIEHVGLNVGDPAAMADWYVKHLGFTIARRADSPEVVRFIVDGSGGVMLELYRNPAAPVPDYTLIDPLVMHVAYTVEDDLDAACRALLENGAQVATAPHATPAGDRIAILRDPWGLPVQLVKRAEPMV